MMWKVHPFALEISRESDETVHHNQSWPRRLTVRLCPRHKHDVSRCINIAKRFCPHEMNE